MDAPSKKKNYLEKTNGQKRFIHALRSEDGTLLSDHADIRKRAVSFYEELYKSESGLPVPVAWSEHGTQGPLTNNLG